MQVQGGNSLASPPVSQQSVPQGANPMQNIFMRPGHPAMPQGGLLHQFPMNAQASNLAGQQQPGLPGFRPANFLQVGFVPKTFTWSQSNYGLDLPILRKRLASKYQAAVRDSTSHASLCMSRPRTMKSGISIHL